MVGRDDHQPAVLAEQRAGREPARRGLGDRLRVVRPRVDQMPQF
jgi:hypothetical protein